MNQLSDTAITLVDRRVIASAVAGDVVPAINRVELLQAQNIVDKMNEIHAQAENEVDGIRRAAYQEGLTAARRRYEAEKMAKLVRFHQRRNELLGKLEDRVGELALAVLKRIAPELDVNELVAAFVQDAIQAAQSEQFLVIKIHPQAEAGARAALQAVSISDSSKCALDIETDESLDPLSCIVESELGTVKTGWVEQLAAIREVLEHESSAGETQCVA